MRKIIIIIALFLSYNMVYPKTKLNWTNKAQETIRLKDGGTVEYYYHFNRNAIQASVLSGNTLIALTRSGSLLLLDSHSLKLRTEYFGTPRATCLTKGMDEKVFVGLSDGTICQVDISNLRFKVITRTEGKVLWLGVKHTNNKSENLVAIIEKKDIAILL